MSIFGNARDFPHLVERGARVEARRQRDYAAALRTAEQAALDRGAALLSLFRTLPDAVVSARTAEHERVVARHGEAHPRARELQSSLAHLRQLAIIGERGAARLARGLAAQRAPGNAFHGFVSDPTGAPLSGVTVRLVGKMAGKAAATTQEDGYFRIGLPRAAKEAASASPPGETARRVKGAPAREALATVTLYSGRTQVYEDPITLRIDLGTAYREYQVEVSQSAREGVKEAGRSKSRRDVP